ncbi:MAG: DUF1963 domain-containing protein, partial [Bacteroidales bacterium]|nr:DUF1963 domain-containing protein [Bacteroidales bacterium]
IIASSSGIIASSSGIIASLSGIIASQRGKFGVLNTKKCLPLRFVESNRIIVDIFVHLYQSNRNKTFMETGLMIALGISLVVGILLIMFNSVSTEATKYKKTLEYVHFDMDTPLTENELQHRLSLLQLDKYWQELQPLMKYEITIKPLPCEDDHIEIAHSKTGGFPHLPADEDIEEGFLFLAQINCAQLKPFDNENLFPDKGMLSFFLHPQKMETDLNNSLMVRYTSSTDNLMIRKDISAFPKIKPALLQFVQTVSLPEYDTNFIQNLLKDYEIDGYFKLTNKEKCHKIAGYPDTVTQPVSINEDKILLLQLDSDELMAMQWGNMGRIYICIEKNKLHDLQFNDLYVYMQSY